MNKSLISALAIFAVMSGEALAQPTDCSNTGQTASPAQVSALLTGNCACGGTATGGWNETHSSGRIYERGNSTSGLGSDIGGYSVLSEGSGGSAIGLVQYAYSGGKTYTYSIVPKSATVGSTVTFCQRANSSPYGLNGISYSIKINGGTCSASNKPPAC